MTWEWTELIVLGVLGPAVAVVVTVWFRGAYRRRQQRRLDQAFRRSKRSSRVGTGEQGKPSRYTDLVSKPD